MVYNASVVSALRDFGDKYYYLRLQLRWGLFGSIALISLSRLDPSFWKKMATPLWCISLFLLLVVLIPGVGNKYLGARRWLGLGSIVFQPAEAAKFSIAIYLAAVLSKKPRLTPFLVSTGLAIGLIMLEPDLGTSIVILANSLIIYFVSGGSLVKLAKLAPFVLIAGLLLVFVSPYRRERLLTYFNPDRDPQGSSYHIRQALIAIGRGGLTGVGLGQSRQKYQYLPEVTTDSIFAIVGEELGLVGSSLLILGFVMLILTGISVARNSENNFEKLLATGMIGWIASQTVVNLGAIVGILPLTGVPLPLVSYGGSSLVVAMGSIGVILSVRRSQHET